MYLVDGRYRTANLLLPGGVILNTKRFTVLLIKYDTYEISSSMQNWSRIKGVTMQKKFRISIQISVLLDFEKWESNSSLVK